MPITEGWIPRTIDGRRYCAICRRWVATIKPAEGIMSRIVIRPIAQHYAAHRPGLGYLCDACAEGSSR